MTAAIKQLAAELKHSLLSIPAAAPAEKPFNKLLEFYDCRNQPASVIRSYHALYREKNRLKLREYQKLYMRQWRLNHQKNENTKTTVD
jgi:hypothetical protein